MHLALISVGILIIIGASIGIGFARSKRRNSTFCAGSQAQFTCDAGGKKECFNSVVVVVSFEKSVPSLILQKLIISNFISHEKALIGRIVISSDMIEWRNTPARWTPEDNVFIHDEPIKESEIEKMAGSIQSRPLCLEKPCWELIVLGSIVGRAGESTSGVIFKYHHALADGSTMLEKMLARAVPRDSNQSISPVLPVSRKVRKASYPFGLISCLKSVYSLLTLRPDPPGLFRAFTIRKPGDKINVALSSSLSLAEVKLIAKKRHEENGFSVNDVLTAIFTRAFRSFTLNNKKFTGKMEDIKSVVWVNLGNKSDSEAWGNSRLGFGYCQLPLSVEDPRACLRECHSRLDRLKHSMDAAVINVALKFIGLLPIGLGKRIARITADMASVSMSNMAGPVKPVIWPVIPGETIIDSTINPAIRSIHFATSPPFHFGPLVSVMSYCGYFHISISARDEVLSHSDLQAILSEIPNAAKDLLL